MVSEAMYVAKWQGIGVKGLMSKNFLARAHARDCSPVTNNAA